MRGRGVLLAVLTVAAMEVRSSESQDQDELPLGFLEFLGGMVEVESTAGPRMVDPLDMRELTEAEQRLDWDAAAAEQLKPAKEISQ